MTAPLPDPDFVARRTGAYFAKTAEIVASLGDARVTYAVFLRTDAVVAIDRALDFLAEIYPADAAIPLEITRPVTEGTLLNSGRPMTYVSGSMAALSPIETLLLHHIGFPCVSAFNAFTMCLALPEVEFLASFTPSRLSRTYATADIVRYELPDGVGGWKVFDLVKAGREFLKLG